VLREIFQPRREEVAGECRKLHNEELYDLYPSPNVVRVVRSGRMRWARHVACVVVRGIADWVFVWVKPGGKRLLGRPRHRW
jgi:hypothetical protein